MRNIDSAPTVRATYLLEKKLEERIIATYFLLLQQPIYYSSFWVQPISKSYSRCPSLLSLPSILGPSILCDCEILGIFSALEKRGKMGAQRATGVDTSLNDETHFPFQIKGGFLISRQQIFPPDPGGALANCYWPSKLLHFKWFLSNTNPKRLYTRVCNSADCWKAAWPLPLLYITFFDTH